MSNQKRWAQNGSNLRRRNEILGLNCFGHANRLKWDFSREFGAFYMDADWRSRYWNLVQNGVVK